MAQTQAFLYQFLYSVVCLVVQKKKSELKNRYVKFEPKEGQIGTKWDKSGTFSDQISVHFGAGQIGTEWKKYETFSDQISVMY